MTYLLDYKGHKYKLADYNAKFAATFNEFDKLVHSGDSFMDRFKNAIYGLTLALGAPVVKDIFKDFETVDVNDVLILFEEVKHVYEKPLTAYTSKKVSDLIKTVVNNENKLTDSES